MCCFFSHFSISLSLLVESHKSKTYVANIHKNYPKIIWETCGFFGQWKEKKEMKQELGAETWAWYEWTLPLTGRNSIKTTVSNLLTSDIKTLAPEISCDNTHFSRSCRNEEVFN